MASNSQIEPDLSGSKTLAMHNFSTMNPPE